MRGFIPSSRLICWAFQGNTTKAFDLIYLKCNSDGADMATPDDSPDAGLVTLSVIIPCFNAADTVSTQLEAFTNQHWSKPWEIIVSDNGSSDNSIAIAERFRKRLPNLRIVDSSDQRGAAHARNVGAKASKGELLAFCDADDEVAPGWLAAISKALTEHEFVASRFEFNKLNAPWIQKNRRPQQDRLQRLRYPPYLLHAGGSGLGVRRSLHEAVGGFDESLPRLMDTDYCLRIQLTGAELHFVPEAVVHVRLRNDLDGIFHQARLWGQYNVLLSKKYRAHGVGVAHPWKQYMYRWKSILLNLEQIQNKRGRAALVSSLGWQIGRLQGSIKYRVPPF
jgi:glycosyltransferase involved in cell wall biosynthesis